MHWWLWWGVQKRSLYEINGHHHYHISSNSLQQHYYSHPLSSPVVDTSSGCGGSASRVVAPGTASCGGTAPIPACCSGDRGAEEELVSHPVHAPCCQFVSTNKRKTVLYSLLSLAYLNLGHHLRLQLCCQHLDFCCHCHCCCWWWQSHFCCHCCCCCWWWQSHFCCHCCCCGCFRNWWWFSIGILILLQEN